MNQANAYNAYKNNSVTAASPTKLVLMLYDGAIKFLKQAEQALEVKDVSQANKYIQKAQDIIMEFMTTLNFEEGGDIARNLHKLYDYMFRRLVSANVNKDVEGVIEVKKYLEELRDTWAQI